MFSKLFLSLLFFATVQSQDPYRPNYFVDIYESSTYYAYPPGFCVQTGVLNFGIYMYECLIVGNDTYMMRTV